jgi:bifunctional non-homologous end joining protein LigD
MHYDFRLEAGGVLISWAVPKGPSYDPRVRRLAVKVDDHPLDYRGFEGLIGSDNYGSGAVIVWDEGLYRNLTSDKGHPVPVAEAVEAGHVSVWLEGHKLVGGWSLTRFQGNNWTLVKRRDDRAAPFLDITREEPRSVKTGRTVQEVGAERARANRASAAAVRRNRVGAGAAGAEAGSTEAGSTEAGSTEALVTAITDALVPAAFCEPMLAQAAAAPTETGSSVPGFGRDDWFFEPKFDGLRTLAVRNGRTVDLYSRNGLSFNARFPMLVRALSALPASNFVIDGEIVGLVGGRPDFAALQHGSEIPTEYWVFDLPWLLGHDLRHLPIGERKDLLTRTVGESPWLKRVPILHGDPSQLFRRACTEGWEGLMAKRVGSAYRGGRSPDWRKLKCARRQEFVIGGFTEPQGARSGFGALLLGYWEDRSLAYAGKVGTGFTEAVLKELHASLVTLQRPTCPFSERVSERGAHWVEPVLVGEVAFSNWTPDGRLRHPSFIALRTDKASEEVVREGAGF